MNILKKRYKAHSTRNAELEHELILNQKLGGRKVWEGDTAKIGNRRHTGGRDQWRTAKACRMPDVAASSRPTHAQSSGEGSGLGQALGQPATGRTETGLGRRGKTRHSRTQRRDARPFASGRLYLEPMHATTQRIWPALVWSQGLWPGCEEWARSLDTAA